MTGCAICGKKRKFSFSPDMGIDGIGACVEHLEDVRMAYVILIQSKGNFRETKKQYNNFIKQIRKDYGIKEGK
jgi:hypothetical protein